MFKLVVSIGLTCLLTALVVYLACLPAVGDLHRRYLLEFCRAEAADHQALAAESPRCGIAVYDGETVVFNIAGSSKSKLICIVDPGLLVDGSPRDCSFS